MCASPTAPWAICARKSRRSRPASGAFFSSSTVTAKKQVLDAIPIVMDHSEAKARARTLTIPDGIYEAESYMDDDGVDIGKKVPIKVKMTVEATR